MLKIKLSSEKILQKFSRFTQAVIVACFCSVGLIILLSGILLQKDYTKDSYYSLLLLFLGTLAFFCFRRYYGTLETKTASLQNRLAKHRAFRYGLFFVLLFLCFMLRLCWVLRYRIDPLVDYYTFYLAADSLSASFDISFLDSYLPRYIALFPHIFGYASFLSLVFSLFGSSPLTAAITNVVLSTVSMAFIYYIGLKLSGRRLAVIASIFWIFFPSQIIYNMFVLSEPYYTTLLLASIALIVLIHSRMAVCPYWETLLTGALTGSVLALANTARPVSVIIIIALIIILFVIQPVQKSTAGKKAAILVSLCVIYFLGGALNNLIFEKRIGEAPASVPGYNIYVGFNQGSRGAWNEADAEVLSKYNAMEDLSAKEVQQKMLDEAVERITAGNINFLKLFAQKMSVLWKTDSGGISYGQTVITHKEAFSALSNGYYYLMWLLSVIGVIHLFRKKQKTILYLLPLYIVGISMAHLFVEVAARYHYSAVIALPLLAAYGLLALGKSSHIDTGRLLDQQ